MPRKVNPLVVPSKAIDSTLNALFASSAGPVQAPAKSRYAAADAKKPSKPSKPSGRDEDEGDDEVLSEISEELDYGDEEDEDKEDDGSETPQQDNDDAMSVTKESVGEEDQQPEDEGKKKRDRKRKRKDENDDLEGKYLAKLAKDEDSEPSGKRQKGDEAKDDQEEDDEEDDEEDKDGGVPVHETLTQEKATSDIEKAARTVFLANVSSEAISSKSAKKELMKHLASVLDQDASPPQKIESLRFRSVAFSTGSMPKRAAYITKALMDATTKSTNAYAVFSSAAAARKVAAELNGTEILGRHIRVDSVAHPSPTDSRRCVFVGNLGFVDDETVLNQKAGGETVEKKRNKTPSDVEEGLWRTFGTQGKVESVRVVRDPVTRVGKGFAYVQFYDGNDVESALLLDGKKFPPMLPRALRVTRAKDPRRTALAMERTKAKEEAANDTRRSMKYKAKATPEGQAAAGRARKLLGRSAAVKQRKPTWNSSKNGEATGGIIKSPEDVIFEGRRASSRDALPKDLKAKKGKGKGKPKNRATRRAAAWKQKK